MPEKSQTPPPPRRVQAPKARTTPSEEQARRGRRMLYGAAAAGLIGLAIAAALFTLGGSDDGPGGIPGALADAGCQVQTFPAQKEDHVEELEEGFEYNSNPPTSGPHHPQPAPFGTYDEPVEELRLVHNLEHGGVVIQYGSAISDETVAEILDWYRGDPNGIIVAPRPDLGSKIALRAWTSEVNAAGAPEEGSGKGVLARCDRFDEGAFDAFTEEYGFKGPERFTRDLLAPGQ